MICCCYLIQSAGEAKPKAPERTVPDSGHPPYNTNLTDTNKIPYHIHVSSKDGTKVAVPRNEGSNPRLGFRKNLQKIMGTLNIRVPMDQPTNQPAVEVLQVILRKPYAELGELPAWLKEHTHNYLIGEHEADEEIATTHCHILVEGLKVTRESLRKAILKVSPGRGQYAIMSVTEKTKVPYETQPLGNYIVKGYESNAKSSSFTEEQIQVWASTWIHRDIKKNSQPVTSVTVKKKPPTIYDNCHEISNLLTWVKEPGQLPTVEERSTIVPAIVHWARQNRIPLHSQQVGNYYDIVLQNCLPEYYIKLCTNIINNRHRFSH